MDPSIIIFCGTLIVYIPIASVLVYVWYKYGDSNPAVKTMRIIFLIGSFVLVATMLAL